MMRAVEVFDQQDGDVTKAYYRELGALGPAGQLAVSLFRAQKRSTAAKLYRGRRFKRDAYDVKNWSIEQVCGILTQYGEALKIRWGWKPDPKAFHNAMVIYVDLPQGQVSFHSPTRLSGPDYPGDWDQMHVSRERILAFCDSVAFAPDPRQETFVY